MKDIVIKKSKINKKGSFAARNFKKGEIILRWHPKFLTKPEMDKLSKSQKQDIDKVGKRYILHRSLERFVNHSCTPNTQAKNLSDIAIRRIKKGEEITTDYYGHSLLVTFKCMCGSKNAEA